MDSLTQFTLGAAISALCLGRKLGPRKAALLGGVLGTIPDLDVLLPTDNPVDAFVFHRGWTHSVFVHAVAAPVVGEILVRGIDALRECRARVWATVFLCFSTHAIIDAMTVYGTRLFWPFYPDPVGVGSIFIIDPLYTIPLLIAVVWALSVKNWSSRLKGGLVAALVFSTTYMGLSVILQANAERRAKAIFAAAGIEARNIFAIAGPFNTVVWKVIGQEDDRYHNLYLSLFDDDDQARLYTHPTRPDLTACLNGNDAFEKLKWFSRGYFRTALQDGKIVVSDLRMGLTPGYVFRFAIAEYSGGMVRQTPPEPVQSQMTTLNDDLNWLAQRLVGQPSVRTAETTGDEQEKTNTPASC
ncbi:metal-dependent hydrolase [Hoeflea prorocentri]|uniref:Metal-dependent hydrolase n=1 Tax=Hoeflea prorocentri TaxID=1922333 RepID=A0A9X3UG29_9HYPH|nr:metal-dependent hydrolase [Hoeflea prorocentri]MCY6379959.1 metal-dependent hydrolase [Hoeflea prorocentri]MDA5397759.1 metal-dependent hydrolase [Hoeflea prorocentri]